MAALAELFPLVRRKCPSVIDMMMLDALKDAYKEFAYTSESIVHTAKLTDVEANKPADLQPPTNFTILKVESVQTTRNGNVKDLYVDDDYNVSLPSSIQSRNSLSNMAVLCVLLPTLDNKEIDERFIALYGEHIAAGAAARLRLMPGEIWSNPDLVFDLRQDFAEGARRAYRDRKDGWNTFHNKVRKRNFY